MTEMRKILIQLKNEDADPDTEYQRTRVNQHAVIQLGEPDSRNYPGKISHNENEALHVIEMIDSSVHPDAYFNVMKKRNKSKMMDTMQGMKTYNNMCFLKVQGVSQL